MIRNRCDLCEFCFARVQPKEELTIAVLAPSVWVCDGCSIKVAIEASRPHVVWLTNAEWGKLRAATKASSL